MEKYNGKIVHNEIKEILIDRENNKIFINLKNGETKIRNLKTDLTSNYTYFMYNGHEYPVAVATRFNKDLLTY